MADLKTLTDYQNQGYTLIEPQTQTLEDYQNQGYQVIEPEAELDRDKLLNDIRQSTRDNEINNSILVGTFLADKIGGDPFDQTKTSSRVRGWLGKKEGEAIPTNADILKTIQDSLNPPKSNIEWQDYAAFDEINKKISAGEKVDPVDLDIGVFSEIHDLFKASSIQKKESAWLNAFKKSRIAKLEYGRQVLSEEMQDFAMRSMITQNFDYETFNRKFTEKEKSYFYTYLGALNPAQDKAFLNEVGTRLKQSFYDIGDSFMSTGRMLEEELITGVRDPKYLYMATRKLKSKEAIRAKIAANIEMSQIRGESAASFMGGDPMSGLIRKGLRTTEEVVQEDTDKIMENYDEMFAEGKAMFDRTKSNRAFRGAIREHFTEKDGVSGFARGAAMSTVSMSLDLAGAMAAGIPTMGLGSAVYSYGRFAGDLREKLMFEAGLEPAEATAVANITALPYVGLEMLQLKVLKGLAGVGKKAATQETKLLFMKGFQESFKKSIMSKTGAKAVEKYVKGYSLEVGQEAMQSLVEQEAMVFAKEFLDGQGIVYADLDKNLRAEIKEAAKGMLLTTGAFQAGGASVRQIFPNKFDIIDTQQAMADKAQTEGTGQYNEIEMAFNENQQAKALQLIELASTKEEKQQLLNDYNLTYSPEEADIKIEAKKNIREEVFKEAKEAKSQEAKELQEIEKEVTVTGEVIKSAVGEFANVEQVSDTEYKLTAQGGAEATYKIIPDKEFLDRFGEGKRGVWVGKESTTYLPASAPDFTLAHENLHMMRDVGVITDTELNQLVKDAELIAPQELKDQIEGLDTESQQQELAAYLIEQIKRTGEVPPQLNTVWEKIKAWVRDISAKFTGRVERSGRTIAKDILAGRPLQRSVKVKLEQALAKRPQVQEPEVRGPQVKEPAVRGPQVQEPEVFSPEEEAQLKEEIKVILDEELAAGKITEEQRQDNIDEVDDIFDGLDFGMLDVGVETTADKEAQRREKKSGEVPFNLREDLGERFSREQEANKDRLAVVNMAKKLYRGEAIPMDTAPEVAQKAQEIVSDAREDIKYVQDDAIINKAIRSAEVKQYYRDKINEIFERGFEAAETLAKEEAVIKKRIAKAKRKKYRPPQAIRDLTNKIKKDIIKQMKLEDIGEGDINVSELIDDIENQVLETLIKEGALERGEAYRNKTAFIESYKAVLADVAARINAFVTPKKDTPDISISEWTNKLAELGTAKSIEDSAKKLLESIDKNRMTIEDAKEQHNKEKAERIAALEEIGQSLSEGIEDAQEFVKKKDKKPKIDQLSQMNVKGQLESIMAYADEDTKKQLDEILLAKGASKILKKQRIKKAMLQFENRVQEEENIKKLDRWRINRSKPQADYKKFSIEQRTDLSTADLMQLWMTLKQEAVAKIAREKDAKGNLKNPDLNRRLNLLTEIESILSAQEKSVAMIMKEIYDNQMLDVEQAYSRQYGEVMPERDADNFPIQILFTEGNTEAQGKALSEKPKITNPEKIKDNDIKDKANIFEVFASRIEDMAHFVETYKSQETIRVTLMNEAFRTSIRNTFGEPTLKQIDESVVDMVADRPVVKPEQRQEIDFVRSVMSTMSIGFNPKSMLVAATGSVNIFATHKGIIQKTIQAMRNPGEVIEDMKFVWDSIVVQGRMAEGISEGMKNSISRAQGNEFIKAYQKLAFFGLVRVDGLVSTIFGGIIYNHYKNSDAAAGLSQAEVEANGLAIINEAIQEAFQPTDVDILPADVRRGSSFAKAFFQFKTEPKSKLGIYFRDWKKIRAQFKQGNTAEGAKGVIHNVIGQHLIVPGAYWLAGEIMRGIAGDDEDKEGALKRLAVAIMLGPAAGLLVWGTGIELVLQLIVGDRIYMGSSIPSDRIMNEVVVIYKTATSDEDASEKIDKMLKRMVPAYRYMRDTFGEE